MNTESRITSAFRFRGALSLLAIALLATGLLAACSSDADAETAAALAALEQEVAELQAQAQQTAQALATEELSGEAKGRITLRVEPAIFKFPSRRLNDSGIVWFYGSGLEPGQWFRILVRAEGEVGELMDFGPVSLRQANGDGSFGLTLPGIRPDRFQGLPESWGLNGGVWAVELWDMDTGQVLASTPWVVCGSMGENAWCPAAVETAVVPEPVVEGSGTVYNLDRFQVEDILFQLRTAATPYWGYEADSRIDSTTDEGIVMTIKLGDTIKFDRLGTSSSRTLTDHRLTIAELGIDLEIGVGFRLEPWELKPDKAGEFVIDDSSHPGEHGKALLIVTE